MSNTIKNFTLYESGFDAVMGRLKAVLGLKTDAALHGLLGMSSSRYANRKRSGSIPYEQVIVLCNSRNVSLNWLFRGEGTAFQDGHTVDVPATLDSDLLLSIYIALFRSYAKEGLRPEDGKEQLFGFSVIAQAVALYNKIVFVQGDGEKKRRIEEDAEGMARAYMLVRDTDVLVQNLGKKL